MRRQGERRVTGGAGSAALPPGSGDAELTAAPGRTASPNLGGRPDLAVGPEAAGGQLLGRREFLALGTGALIVLSVPLARRRGRTLVRRSVPVMGTVAEVALVSRDERRGHAVIDAALEELRLVEALMTRFRPDSDVGRANRAPPGTPVAVTPETATVLRAALRWAEATDGRFDPCLERAVVLWNVGERRRPPPPEAVRRFAGRRLYRQLELEWRGETPALRLHDPDAGIDLGGIAKGYGVDRAVRALREGGVESALVNVGGDLYALGRSEDGDPWKIGIRSPADPRRLAATVQVSDRALATSGDYLQYFEYGGRRYHHLLDPRTGEPLRAATHSVTAAAARCMAADAAATAAFGTPPAAARRLLEAAEPGAEPILVA